MRARRSPPAVAALAAVLLGCQGGETDPGDARAGESDDQRVEDDPAPRDDVDAAPRDEQDPGADDDAGEDVEHAEASGPGPPPEDVAPFDDATELAAALSAAETALADPDTPTSHLDGWAVVHQQAYRDLADRPEWRQEARAAVPGELRDAHDLTLHAVAQLLELTEPQEELPDWRIEPPPPSEELRGHYLEAEEAFDVPAEVLAAIHLIETRFGRIHGDSHAGAQGPMQFMPSTWDAYGEGDVDDPRDAILAAGRFLAASGAPDDLEGAVFAYNRSDRYVEAVLAHAEAMERHEHYLDVYHGWRVYYRTVDGDVLLEATDEG
jgi:hypothetical protein